MEFVDGQDGRAEEIVGLFEATFTASEGAEEGRLIGRLVAGLLATTPPGELFVFSAREAGALIGCILFTRLHFPQDAPKVVLLSPVAVAPDRQGQGVGQALLGHGLARMAETGAEVAVTYGDPGYYARVGFRPVTVEAVAPPHPLSQPEGWLAQGLTGAPLGQLTGPSRCAPAFDDPSYW